MFLSPLIIFRVCHDCPDVNNLRVVMNRCFDSYIISTNIKYRKWRYIISRVEAFFDLTEGGIRGFADDMMPAL